MLVAVAAAQSSWAPGVAAAVAGLLLARGLGKTLGIALGCAGSGLRWRQSLGVASALGPMSSVALLLVSELAQADPALGARVAALALPSILLMQMLGAALAMTALHRSGESSRAIAAQPPGDSSPVRQGAGVGRP